MGVQLIKYAENVRLFWRWKSDKVAEVQIIAIPVQGKELALLSYSRQSAILLPTLCSKVLNDIYIKLIIISLS